MQVSYCASVLRAPYAVDPRAAVLTVGASLINHNYMTPEIRLKGNAYGASFSFHSLGGTFSMGSYRDPHLARTLGVFEGVRDYVSKAEWSQADVDQAIINTAKNDDRPIRPGDATASSLIRHLSGLTPEWREARYRGLRAATPGAVKSALLDALEAGRPTATVCVVSNRERLEEANRELGAKPLAIANILPS
ncbi:MAG TPA: hypothetical protein VFK80_00525, partial [Limnochordia bacterium]|nr:hypothetical protein [Limnochordia bacterium]